MATALHHERDTTRSQTRVVGIYVSNDPREDSWAAAIDPTGSVLDHLQIPRQRDAKAKKLKVSRCRTPRAIYHMRSSRLLAVSGTMAVRSSELRS